MTEEDEEFNRIEREASLRKAAVAATVEKRGWVGLTRAECLQIEKDMAKYYDYRHECKTVCLPEFAKAIEAKLKEKNEM
jgi:hypothetical protein